MSAVPFPLLVSSDIEQGLCCRRCELTHEIYVTEGMDSSTLSRLVPPDYLADQFLLRMKYRACSDAEFVRHAKHCHSAHAVISERRIGSAWRELG